MPIGSRSSDSGLAGGLAFFGHAGVSAASVGWPSAAGAVPVAAGVPAAAASVVGAGAVVAVAVAVGAGVGAGLGAPVVEPAGSALSVAGCAAAGEFENQIAAPTTSSSTRTTAIVRERGDMMGADVTGHRVEIASRDHTIRPATLEGAC